MPAYIGYVLVVLGVAVLVRVGLREVRLALFGQSADGVIVALTKSRSARSGPRLTVQFERSPGRTSVFQTLGMYPTPYAVGQACRVRYLGGDSSEPPMAEIESWVQFWRATLVALALGFALAGGGALIVRSARRRTRGQVPAS